jgi:hypothetical protein
MDTLHQDVLEAISSLEKVGDALSPANGKSLLVTAKYTCDDIVAGNTYDVINHSGHYYWLVCGGRWIDKDLFNKQ